MKDSPPSYELKRTFTRTADETTPLPELSSLTETNLLTSNGQRVTTPEQKPLMAVDYSTRASDFFPPLIPEEENASRPEFPPFALHTNSPVLSVRESTFDTRQSSSTTHFAAPAESQHDISGFSLLRQSSPSTVLPQTSSRVQTAVSLLRYKERVCAAIEKEAQQCEARKQELEERNVASEAARTSAAQETEALTALVDALTEDCRTTESLVEKYTAELEQLEARTQAKSSVVVALENETTTRSASSEQLGAAITQLQHNVQHILTLLKTTHNCVEEAQSHYTKETERFQQAYSSAKTRINVLDRLAALVPSSNYPAANSSPPIVSPSHA